uniref:Ovule protein n=1 Tax=Ascaris lumbricoides TaxID=6252 RepID=A0A0M3HKH2_ASCLU
MVYTIHLLKRKRNVCTLFFVLHSILLFEDLFLYAFTNLRFVECIIGSVVYVYVVQFAESLSMEK